MSSWQERIQGINERNERSELAQGLVRKAESQGREAELNRHAESVNKVWALNFEKDLKEINEGFWQGKGKILKTDNTLSLSADYQVAEENWEKITEHVYEPYDAGHMHYQLENSYWVPSWKVGWRDVTRKAKLTGPVIDNKTTSLSINVKYPDLRNVLRITVSDSKRNLKTEDIEGVETINPRFTEVYPYYPGAEDRRDPFTRALEIYRNRASEAYVSHGRARYTENQKKSIENEIAQLGNGGSLVLEFRDEDFNEKIIREFMDLALLSSSRNVRNFATWEKNAKQQIADITSRIGEIVEEEKGFRWQELGLD